MSKVLTATCTANTVTTNAVAIAPITILSEGKGASSGITILDEDKAYYVTSNATDLKNTISKLSDSILYITNCFTALDALPTISGACASFTAQLLVIKAQLDLLKENLK